MKTIRFPVLGIEMEVGDNIDYRDDGIVKFYWEHLIKLNRERGGNPYEFIPKRLITKNGEFKSRLARSDLACCILRALPKGGSCFTKIYDENHIEVNRDKEIMSARLEKAVIEGIGYVYVRTFQKKELTRNNNLFIGGHEQTHALLILNGIDLLEDELSKIGVANLESLLELFPNSKETICDVGGFYAVIHAYPNKRNIQLITYGVPPYTKNAGKWLYENSQHRINIDYPRFGLTRILVER